MKKIVLFFMCFSSLWINISTVSAQESYSVEQSSAVERPILTQDSVSAVEPFAVNETTTEIKGVFGTVPWTFEQETGALTFGGGEFPETNENTNIKGIIAHNTLLKGKTISKIIFTAPINAHSNSSYLFAYLSNLETIENIHYLDISNVTNMYRMFQSAYSLTSLDLSKWDTSNATNMSWMFAYASIRNLDLSNWNTSNVTDMSYMFRSMTDLRNLDLSN